MDSKKTIHDFSCQIKFDILLDLELSANELRLYGLIEAMQHNTGEVFFGNNYLSKTLQVSARSIQLMTKKLKEKGYIDKRWVPEKKKHCWFIKGEAELRFETKHSFAKGVKYSFTHIANNINTINKGNIAHAISKNQPHNQEYQDYAGDIIHGEKYGILPKGTKPLSLEEWLKYNQNK